MLENVSPALQERLGPEATVGLLAALEASRREWSAEVTDQSVERFERRLTKEMSLLRLGCKQSTSDLRVELKQDMNELRLDFARLEGRVDKALLTQTQWMIGMWVGQIAATAAIVAGMFQAFTR